MDYAPGMDTILSVFCGGCGEEIELVVDRSMGSSQEYVEDCPVCCRANVVRVQLDAEGVPHGDAELE